MSLTTSSIATMFAPLATQSAYTFFMESVSPDVVWTFGCPGATHALASRYEGSDAFVGATFARIAAMVAGPLVTTVEGSIVDASGESAAVLLRTVGEAKSGLKVDDRACWVIKAKDGKLVEITSYVDSAFLEKLIAENRAFLDAPLETAA